MAFKPSETAERSTALAQFEPHLMRLWREARREIRQMQRSRDTLLVAVLLIVGAVVVAVLLSKSAQGYLREPDAIAWAIAIMGIVTLASWLRRKRLERIGAQWSILCRLVQPYFDHRLFSYFPEWEAYGAIYGSKSQREDLALNYLLSIPAYGIVALQILEGVEYDEHAQVAVAGVIVICHLALSWKLLADRLDDLYAVRNPSLTDPSTSAYVHYVLDPAVEKMRRP
ncbi:MAG: hypothetical protein ACKVU1_02625 [bacterium]